MVDYWTRGIESGVPKLIIVMSDRLAYRSISQTDKDLGWNVWAFTPPIPLRKILQIQETYYNIFLILGITEDDKYAICRLENFKNPTIVHTHESEIHGIFYVDLGHTIISAADGWFATQNTGLDWDQITIGGPKAKNAVVVGDLDVLGYYIINAYGVDQKLYYFEYTPQYCYDGDWLETFDTKTIQSGVWYPALDGGQVGLLAGAGNILLASETIGKSWQVKKTFGTDNIIKNIRVSANSKTPIHFITVDVSGADKIYRTNDLAATLTLLANRTESNVGSQSVFPTAKDYRETTFVVISRLDVPGNLTTKYQIITEQSEVD